MANIFKKIGSAAKKALPALSKVASVIPVFGGAISTGLDVVNKLTTSKESVGGVAPTLPNVNNSNPALGGVPLPSAVGPAPTGNTVTNSSTGGTALKVAGGLGVLGLIYSIFKK